MPHKKILIFCLIFICFIGGLALGHGVMQNSKRLSDYTFVFPTPRNMPEYSVLNHLDEKTNQTDLLGHWSIMFFGFTHCPDICPNTLASLVDIQKSFAADKQPEIILVSVDPMRDTPQLINQYISSFGGKISAYTGELHQIQDLTSELGVAYAYNAMPNNDYTVDHSTSIFIINPEGQYVGVFTESLNTTENIKALRKDIQLLIH